MKTTTLVTLCTLALTIGVANAVENGAEGETGKECKRPARKARGEHPGGEATQAFIKTQREAGLAHHQAQVKETKALMESLREGEPQAGCKALAENRQTQADENAAFQQGQVAEIVAFMQKNATEQDIPAEKVAEHIEKKQAYFEARSKKHAEMSAAFIAKLNKLSEKEDLTWKEVEETMKSMHRKGRKGHRGGKHERRGKHERKGKGEGGDKQVD
jgi:hypothetical protein